MQSYEHKLLLLPLLFMKDNDKNALLFGVAELTADNLLTLVCWRRAMRTTS